MKVLLFLLVILFVAYVINEYRRLAKAVKLSHITPDQTGEFDIGSKNAQPFNFLLIGDSIAAGTGINSFEHSLGGRLTAELSKTRHVHLSNRAEKGSWASDLALDKVQGHWDLVVIIVGSNELIHMVPIRDFRRSLRRLLKELHPKSGHIALVGPGDVASAHVLPAWIRLRLKGKQRRLAETMRQIADDVGVEYINPLEHRNSQSYFSNDGLHPNSLGHKVWFDIIWGKLASRYEAKSRPVRRTGTVS